MRHNSRHGPELRRRLFRRYDCTGDRDGGNCQVCPHHGQTVLRHRRRGGYRGRYLGIYRHEQRGAGRKEEDHDGRGSLHFPNRCRTSTSDVLRSRRINLPHDERQGRTLSRLPVVQGSATAFGVHGDSGTLHLLGGGCCRRSHRRFYNRLLSRRVRGRTGRAGCGRLGGYRLYHAQTAERAAYQERRARGVYLCPLEEAVRRKEKPSRATCGLVEC